MALVPNPVTGQLDVAEQVTVEGIAGTGTAGTIAKFTDTEQIGDSIISDDGSTATVDGDLDVLGDILVNGTPISTGSPGGSDGAVQFNDGGNFGGLNRRVVEVSGIVTTDDSTPVAVTSLTLSADTVYRILVEAEGRSTAVGVGAVGDLTYNVSRIAAKRVSGGAVVINVQSTISALSFTENTTPNINATANGNDIDITITGGDAGTTVTWRFLLTIDAV